ncbi:MAG: citrate synthase [Terrimicrobiaceae bacterium]
MSDTVALVQNNQELHFPVITGSEGERGINISKLRDQTGMITFDDGFGNTGSCESSITFIDGEKGILRYRGYPIEELAVKSTFIEVAWLVIHGELPSRQELRDFSGLLTEFQVLHESMKHHFEGFPPNSHPMAILSSMINACGCFTRELSGPYDPEKFSRHSGRLISQVRTIAAFAYRTSRGLPIIYPKPDYKYTANFLHMMFSMPNADIDLDPVAVAALDQIFLLHADHEQNCSTSTVRMVASSKANLFASAAAGVCALWGPLHGGANQAVLEMLGKIREDGDDGSRFIEAVKTSGGGARLMGFGHRVYKNYDPRARIIKEKCEAVLAKLHVSDPLLDIAQKLEETALKDEYFLQRKLYPNVDFYSGIIMRALKIPTEMFTVMFAIGRMPGWIANFKEVADDPKSKIYRPRQIYSGANQRSYVPIEDRRA